MHVCCMHVCMYLFVCSVSLKGCWFWHAQAYAAVCAMAAGMYSAEVHPVSSEFAPRVSSFSWLTCQWFTDSKYCHAQVSL